MVDLNELAKEVTLEEGGKQSMSIAQVKEVMGILLRKLAKLPPKEVVEILSKYV